MRRLIAVTILAILLPAAVSAQTGLHHRHRETAGTLALVPSVNVWVVRNGEFKNTNTDALGAFTISDLAPGNLPRVHHGQQPVRQRDSATSPALAPASTSPNGGGGATITVTAGSTSSGVDFTLALSGRISGTVVDVNGGTPIGSAFVIVVAADGQSIASGEVSGLPGEYTVTYGMPTGTYYAHSTISPATSTRFHPDVVCPTHCNGSDAVATGTPIPVTTLGATTAGINFALARGATIAGRVTDESTLLGVEDVTIAVFDQHGDSLFSMTTDSAGDYVSPGLVAGTYYLSSDNELGLINELYDNVPCAGSVLHADGRHAHCRHDRTGGDAAVTSRSPSAAGLPAPSARPRAARRSTRLSVKVYSATGVPVTEASSDDNGNYLTTTGLLTGDYYLVTRNFGEDYLDEIYDDVPCLGCDPIDVVKRGTVVTVTAGATTGGRNIQLTRGGTISGRVVSTVGGAAVGGIEVRAVGSDGGFGQDRTDATGHYTIGGLPAGQFVAWTVSGASVGFLERDLPRPPLRRFLRRHSGRLPGSANSARQRGRGVEHRLRAGAERVGQRHRDRRRLRCPPRRRQGARRDAARRRVRGGRPGADQRLRQLRRPRSGGRRLRRLHREHAGLHRRSARGLAVPG